MATRYLTKEQIIRIHRELIERYGGLPGVRDQALLESAIGRHQSGYYADVIEEAAALLQSLGSNSPFNDGNKRIAVNATLTFLIINGYELLFDEKQLFDFLVEFFESHQFSFAALDPWLRKYVAELVDASEEAADEAKNPLSPSMETCLNAMERLYLAREKLGNALEQRGTEMNAITSQLPLNESLGPSIIEKQSMLITRRMVSLFRRFTLDLDEYSQQVDSEGNRFLQGWATISQWVEDQIPRIKAIGDLIKLSEQFTVFKEMTERVRSNAYLIPKSFESLFQSADNLSPDPPFDKSALNKMYKQFVGSVQNAKRTVEACTKSHSDFDEQLTIIIDSCDQVASQIDRRLDQIRDQK